MYFQDRHHAGQVLADKLFHAYGKTNAVVLAVKDGAVLVGEPIAQRLEAPLMLLQMRNITLPGMHQEHMGTIDQSGGFRWDSHMSDGEKREWDSEYHGHIEQQKMEKMSEINRMISATGDIDRATLQDRNIILVSDGANSASLIDAAVAFLKPVRAARVVAAVPIASVAAVDKMHVLTDEIHVLSATPNYISTEHYYDDNAIPGREEIQNRMQLFEHFL